MDETGQPGGATPREGGGSAGARADSPQPTSGWTPGDSGWSNAGAALEPSPDPVLPPWRQPIEPVPARAWSDSSSRYADLLAPIPRLGDAAYANGSHRYEARPGQSAGVIASTPSSAPPYPYEGDLEDAARGRRVIPAARPAPPDELSGPLPPPDGEATEALETRSAFGDSTAVPWRDGERGATGADAGEPASADDQRPDPVSGPGPEGSSAWPDRPVFPSPYLRPSYDPSPPTSGPSQAGYEPPVPPYQADDPEPDSGASSYEPAAPSYEPVAPSYEPVAPSYEPVAPSYEPAPPSYEPAPPSYGPTAPSYARERTGFAGRAAVRPATAGAARRQESAELAGATAVPEAASNPLPQRVPAEPDVPAMAEPPAVEPPTETPELARIATHLRRADGAPQPRPRTEGFDVNAILAAVRGVPGVRDASLRTTPAGAHSLRLDLHDGSDPAEVSREVARLLQDRMGLAAAPRRASASHPTDPPITSGAPAHAPTLPPPDEGDTGSGGPGTSGPDVPRRRRQAFVHRGRATVTGRAPAPDVAGREAPGAGRAPGTGDGVGAAAGTAPPTAATASEASGTGMAPAETAAIPGVAWGDASSASTDCTATRDAAETQTPPVGQNDQAATVAPEWAADTAENVGGAGEVLEDPREAAEVGQSLLTGGPATASDMVGSADTDVVGTADPAAHLATWFPAPQTVSAGRLPTRRVVLDEVQVSTFGLDATVEVRLSAGEAHATGLATGPAVDGYMLRLCAAAAAAAIDELLSAPDNVADRGRCFVEHATLVSFGTCEVATVVVLLVCDGWVEQLAGSALVAGDQRQAAVRATLAAVNRRLEALLS